MKQKIDSYNLVQYFKGKGTKGLKDISELLKIYEGDPVQNPWCIHSNVKNSINDGNVNEKILILDQKEPQMSKDLSYKSLVTGK